MATTYKEAEVIARNIGIFLGRIYVRRNIKGTAASEFNYLVNRASKLYPSSQSNVSGSLFCVYGSRQGERTDSKDRS